MAGSKLLVYLLRRDLRATDNPILHHLATADHGFTHLLPVYVLPPHQIEVSGFLTENHKSPYPQALSQVGRFWRCGPHRAKFTAESIWDLKDSLEDLGSGLVLRIGSFSDVVRQLIQALNDNHHSVDAVWMTEDVSSEEVDDQDAVSAVCSEKSVGFKLWRDDKYFVDDRDTGLSNPKELPDVFTSYRKTQEPLRERPRRSVPRPQAGSLPPLPPWTPPQDAPFQVPDTYEEFERRLLQPIDNMIVNPPAMPQDAKSAHPFDGGESFAWERVRHLVKTGGMCTYQETRNGLLGEDFSTKLSAYLALGCISARSIHEELLKLEDGTDQAYVRSKGFGRGENDGTKAVRFELLWRDYMRLCTMKFGAQLFRVSGFKGATGQYEKKWKTANKKMAAIDQDPSPEDLGRIIDRFLQGTTGMGLIDASQRELYHTGYTSNRARQNVASFFSKHLGIDWRYGAEWYEMMLVDYDVSSNWANWQYVAGVGNDPRGDARIFNPVKQAFDYDTNGTYVRTWVPEVKYIEKLENVFQVWTTDEEELLKYGIVDDIMVTQPVKKIDFQVDRKPRGPRRPYRWRRGPGRGGRRGGGPSNGSGDYSDMGRNHNGGPPSPESDRQFYNGEASYIQSNQHPRGGWAPGGNQATPWRGNSNGYGNGNGGRGGHGMSPFRGGNGNGFQRGFATNSMQYNNPPPPRQQYMPAPSYPVHGFPPHAYHHQLPPHLGPHV
ncbi:putative cryptochrome DASH [Fusarium duplospermum]|uniref:Cryptochrome DASH n=1 Tax=Fusarium duplospermum TaxID=1325734 RepID=A0A428PLA4_9HYPO|nr:putative cryptochrome DASH [Fusarium duplospermum]